MNEVDATPVRCAIVGCGMVADEYARTLTRSPAIDLIACADLDPERGRAFAVRHQVPYAPGLDELLDAGKVELLVILTPPETHVSVAAPAVAAGLGVYVEKPLALSGEHAAELLALAVQHQVPVGAAPDTFLAPPCQDAAAAIAEGRIGVPIAASASLLTSGPERWHPAPGPLYAPGTGPLVDLGPYYLTQVVYLLGSIDRVDGALATTRTRRVLGSGPRAGQVFEAQAFTHVEAHLRTVAGALVTLTVSCDVQASTRPHIEIYGTEGTLVLPDPNFHHGTVRLRRRGESSWRDLPRQASQLAHPVGRGMGVVELATVLRTGDAHRVTGPQALHVCRVMDAIREAAAISNPVPVACDRPGLTGPHRATDAVP